MRRLPNLPLVANRCDYETATRWGAHWTKAQAVDYAIQKEIPVIDLYKADATKLKWDAAIKDQKAIMVCGVGHGNETRYTGQNQQDLLNATNPADLAMMKGKFGSFLSCVFGASVKKWIDAGMLGFYGYNRTFWFVTSTFPNASARPFFVSHFSFDRVWENRGTTDEAWTESDKVWIDELAKADAYTRQYLLYDYQSRVKGGDGKLGPYVGPPPPKYQCYWSDYGSDDLEDVKRHILQAHCPACPPWPERPAWCQWFGDLVGCPLPKD